MKIIISEKEIYEIKLDNDEITAEDFAGLMDRLRVIEKILSKSDIVAPRKKYTFKEGKFASSGSGRGYRVSYPWTDNKAELIKAFKVYYGTKEQKEELSKKLNHSWSNIAKNLFYHRSKSNITPKDLGMKYFPSLRGKNINIKQAKIKGDDYD